MSTPKDLASAAKVLGNAALAKKDFDAAIAHYTEAISHDPKDHVFFSNRSAAYLSKGNAASALADAQSCVELNPSWAKGYSRLGAALHGEHKLTEAIDAYTTGLKLEPTNEALKSGLEDAQQALEQQRARAAAPPRRAPGGGNPFGGLFGPGMMEKIAANPKFAPYLADEAFAARLRKLANSSDPVEQSAALTSVLGGGGGMIPGMPGGGEKQDPRMMEVIMFLLGVGAGGPGGSGGMGMDEDDDGDDGFPAYGAGPSGGAHDGHSHGADGGHSHAGHSHGSASSSSSAPAPEAKMEEDEAPLDEEAAAKRAAKKAAAAAKEAGTRAYKARDFPAALAHYTEASTLDADDITHLLNIAAVHFEAGELDACVATCRKALERGGEVMAPFALKAKAWTRIGNAEAKRGALPAALEAYESSLLESHTDEVYEKAKKIRVEIKKAAEAAYLDPAKGAEAKERGNVLFKAGSFPGAVAEYTEAIKRDPGNVTYYNNRAAARTKLMDISGALEDANKVLSLDAKNVKAICRKGALQVLTKEFHKAVESYQQALALEPDNDEAKDGLRSTVRKINESSSSKSDPERAARAMADPEIQSILRDPMVNAALEDMQRDSSAMRRVMADPTMAAKIQKLIAAGVLGVQ